MAITSQQKAALEKAGYTVGKSGKTILNAKGESVGGYNENGNIWSGSTKVANILKTKDTAPAPQKLAASRKASATPAAEKSRPKARPEQKAASGGRGDGAKETARRKADAAPKPSSPAKAAAAAAPLLAVGKKVSPPRNPAQAKPTNPSYKGGAKMPEGFQGKYATGVARPGAAGAKAIPGSPARRMVSGGKMFKIPEIFNLHNMAKGGLVAKKKK